jgi:hypothetical protein
MPIIPGSITPIRDTAGSWLTGATVQIGIATSWSPGLVRACCSIAHPRPSKQRHRECSLAVYRDEVVGCVQKVDARGDLILTFTRNRRVFVHAYQHITEL